MAVQTNSIRMYAIHAHSPIHVGVGEGIGNINLPTAREKTTGHPLLPGSSIKGVLREQAERQWPEQTDLRYGNDLVVQVFGPPTERAGDARGGVVFSDATLLCLPVRSLLGVFALATCPLILQRLLRELHLASCSTPELDKALTELCQAAKEGVAVVHPESSLIYPRPAKTQRAQTERAQAGQAAQPTDSVVILEEQTLTSRASAHVQTLSQSLATWSLWDTTEAEDMQRRLVVLSNDDFSFLVRTGLEVRHRVKIDDTTGTAATSGPWLEEYIPAEALFFGLVLGRRTALVEKPQDTTNGNDQRPIPKSEQENLSALETLVREVPILRLGGKSSGGAGRGRIRLI